MPGRDTTDKDKAYRAPNYLSLQSADLILSEIRPTKIKPEALLTVNVFIDELLWLILNAARSLSTERLSRHGLQTILPTQLGKEALLEAEVELKAYWDRTDPVNRGSMIEHNPRLSEFPLQTAFELMRLKCEVYSTLGDVEEDVDAENALQSAMMTASQGPPRPSAVAPAALYITAMLEHICEHILSNVAKVVARDSSRTTAHISDLYVALCEDDAIYPLFKRMKVKEQLELQSKSVLRAQTPSSPSPTQQPPPRRSKSMSVRSGSGPSPTATVVLPPSTIHGTMTSYRRPSVEGGRASGEGAGAKVKGGHRRSDSSSMSDGTKRTVVAFNQANPPVNGSVNGHGSREKIAETESMDGQPSRSADFEDLMRSGTTMKVSLTPDRLKTFEVFSKEKNQPARTGRSNSVTGASAASEPGIPLPSSPPSSVSSPTLSHKSSRGNLIARAAQVKVESIEEAEDEDPQVPTNGNPRVFKPRSRTQSLAQFLLETPPWEGEPPTTDSNAPTPPVDGAARSRSGSNASSAKAVVPAPPPKKPVGTGSGYLSPNSAPNSPPPSAFSPKRMGGARRRARNIEDIDIDELLNKPDEDEQEEGKEEEEVKTTTPAPSVRRLPPSRKNSVSGTGPVSASTREMIDFLSEGPPDVPSLPSTTSSLGRTPSSIAGGTTPNGSIAPSTASSAPTSKKAPGRFGRMISRLARSSSSEQMNVDGHRKKGSSSAEDISSSIPNAIRPPASLKVVPLPKPPLPQWTQPNSPPPQPVLQASPAMSDDSHASAVARRTPVVVPVRKPAPPTSPTLAPVQPRVLAMKTREEPLDYDSSATRSRPSTAASAVPSIEVSPDVDEEVTPQPVPQPNPKRPSTADKGVGGAPEPPVGVEVPEGSIFVDGFKAARMRALMNRATSVEECQILVEMFLAQWGVPRVSGEEHDEATLLPYAQGETVKEDPVDEELHHSIVDALLGEGGAIQELVCDDTQTDDAHDNPPRTPNTPSEAKLPSEAYMPPPALKQKGDFPLEYTGQGPAIVPSSPPAIIAA